MAKCYYPGCTSHANTKEHIPPKSFFPDSKKLNLMTVKSCKVHNNEKTKDDIYVLANICLNTIVDGGSDAQEVFESNVKPQLMHNNESLLKKVLKNSSKRQDGINTFEVDISRLNSFFECLTYGVIQKKTGRELNIENYSVGHIYLNLEERDSDGNLSQIHLAMKNYWKDNLLHSTKISETLEFKVEPKKGYSTEIYSVRFMGIDFMNAFESGEFNSSITVIHKFYDHFVVISLLTRDASFSKTPIHISMPNFSEEN
ncbi:hypothetical protein [Morganella morganii]|uniref:hypothetical protein n=1 Tax=Morganella morganii TaxID=582 RepID=UPI0021A4244A|nr:hypothetical protein [Morganella morganii]